jgi:hypothetical protein
MADVSSNFHLMRIEVAMRLLQTNMANYQSRFHHSVSPNLGMEMGCAKDNSPEHDQLLDTLFHHRAIGWPWPQISLAPNVPDSASVV